MLELEGGLRDAGLDVRRKVVVSVENRRFRQGGGARKRRGVAGEIEEANQLGGLEVCGLFERAEMVNAYVQMRVQ